MDITSVVGAVALVGLVVGGAISGALPAFFINEHGLVIVLGGTGAAMLLNTPIDDLKRAAASLKVFWRGGHYPPAPSVVVSVTALAEQVHKRGAAAFQDADQKAVQGYLRRAAMLAVQYNDPDLVESILTSEINVAFDRHNEVVNVFRTAAILAPMFGLLGTLIGIVSVLKQISNPETVGGAMAIAMTTAFYGISLANVFCVPVAGKLRLRGIEEHKAKVIVAEGVVLMMRGTIPLVIERKLQAHL